MHAHTERATTIRATRRCLVHGGAYRRTTARTNRTRAVCTRARTHARVYAYPVQPRGLQEHGGESDKVREPEQHQHRVAQPSPLHLDKNAAEFAAPRIKQHGPACTPLQRCVRDAVGGPQSAAEPVRVVGACVPLLSFLVLHRRGSADGTRARNTDGTGRNSRHNTGFEDGLFGLPAGHLNPGEGVVAAAVREVRRTRPRLRARSHSLRTTSLSLCFQ